MGHILTSLKSPARKPAFRQPSGRGAATLTMKQPPPSDPPDIQEQSVHTRPAQTKKTQPPGNPPFWPARHMFNRPRVHACDPKKTRLFSPPKKLFHAGLERTVPPRQPGTPLSGDLCKTALVFPTLQRSGGKSVIKGKNSWKMRLGRASLTHIFPLFDAIGHNDPWRAVQVVGDCLHDVLRVCPGQSHIPCHTGPEPPVH